MPGVIDIARKGGQAGTLDDSFKDQGPASEIVAQVRAADAPIAERGKERNDITDVRQYKKKYLKDECAFACIDDPEDYQKLSASELSEFALSRRERLLKRMEYKLNKAIGEIEKSGADVRREEKVSRLLATADAILDRSRDLSSTVLHLEPQDGLKEQKMRIGALVEKLTSTCEAARRIIPERAEFDEDFKARLEQLLGYALGRAKK